MPKDNLRSLLPLREYIALLNARKVVTENAVQVQGRVKVRAEEPYTNGDLGIPWKYGEVREIPMELLNRLRKDNPNNWRIID